MKKIVETKTRGGRIKTTTLQQALDDLDHFPSYVRIRKSDPMSRWIFASSSQLDSPVYTFDTQEFGQLRTNEAQPVTSSAMVAAALAHSHPTTHRKPKAKRKRKGWGPFQSVLKERSVNFNLSLDVQSLHQEIRQLTTLRDLLQSRRLLQPQSETGSLSRIVHEYCHLFRRGYRVEQRPHSRVVTTATKQSDFLRSVVDEDIDFGVHERGVDVMIEQIRRYSLMMRFICMQMDRFEIVTMDEDDVVLIKTTGYWRIQILRETVVGLFPHVMANEYLISKLVGAEVICPTSLDFYFNSKGLMCRYQTHVDFVACFTQLLSDPADAMEVLGKSKLNINVNNMIGVSDDGHIEDVETFVCTEDTVSVPTEHRQPSINHGVPMEPTLSFHQRTAERYIAILACGWSNIALVDRFLREFVSPFVIVGRATGYSALEQVVRAMEASADLISYRQCSIPQTTTRDGVTTVRVAAAYDLRLHEASVHRIFPHLLRYPSITRVLLGAEIVCPSLLELHWDRSTEDNPPVTRIVERLDWDLALSPLFPRSDEREFVLHEARLSHHGQILPLDQTTRL